MSRAHIGLKTKLCSALCQMMRYVGDGEWKRIISHEEAKTLTEDQILARFDFHHDPIPKAHDGPDVHWNLTPMPKAEHKIETATVTVPTVAKGKRIRRKAEESRQRRLAKDCGEPAPQGRLPKPKIASRPFSKEHRPLRSRNTFAQAGAR